MNHESFPPQMIRHIWYNYHCNATNQFKYYIVGKFGEFSELSLIHQTKNIQISTYNYNLLAESIYSPKFFRQMLKTIKFANLLPHQTFPLYSKCNSNNMSIILH